MYMPCQDCTLDAGCCTMHNVLYLFATGKVNSAGNRMDVWENFKDYSLAPPVGLIRADAHTPPFRPGLQVMICLPFGMVLGGAQRTASHTLPSQSA